MGYTFFEYLAAEQQRYRMSLFVSVAAALFAITVITVALPSNSNSINSYDKYEGTVVNVEYTIIQKPSGASFKFNKLENQTALMITTKNNVFYVNEDFDSYWIKIMSEIQSGDNITIYYRISPKDGSFIIRQIESNNKIVVPNSFKYKKGVKTLVIMIVILLFAIVILIGLIRKRKLLGNSRDKSE